MNTKHKIEVMQAWLDGKTIQCSDMGCDNWIDIADPSFDSFETMQYRIKPAEPKKVKFLCYMSNGHLEWIEEEKALRLVACGERVPSEDKEVTLCTD